MRKFVLLVLAILLLAMTACSATPEMEADRAPAAAQAPAPAADAAPAEDWDFAEEAILSAADVAHWPTDDESFLPLPILTPSDDRGRRMVYTVTMRLQTPEFMPGVRTLLDEVGTMGGYLTSLDVYGRDMRVAVPPDRHAHMIFRLPTETLGEFIVMVENTYNIWSLRQRTEDETVRYQQATDAQDDLQAEEAWLIEQLEEADEDERPALQSRLADVRRLIREQERTQETITDRVIYSTVEITLYEAFSPQDVPPVDPPTFFERVREVASDSLGAFVAFLQGFAIVLIALLPWIPVIGIILLLIWLFIRWYKRDKQRQAEFLAKARQEREEKAAAKLKETQPESKKASEKEAGEKPVDDLDL